MFIKLYRLYWAISLLMVVMAFSIYSYDKLTIGQINDEVPKTSSIGEQFSPDLPKPDETTLNIL